MKNRFVIRLLLIVVAVNCWLTLNVAAQEQCRTKPDGDIGNCINLSDCSVFYNMLINIEKSATAATDRITLKSNQCGLRNGQVLICCPEQSHNGANKPECGTVNWQRTNTDNSTKIDEHPWFALVEYTNDENKKEHLCSGALINKRYVLTAAHCVMGIALRDQRRVSAVRLGEWDTATNPDCIGTRCAPVYQDIPIAAAIPHPEFQSNRNNQLYDVALLRLQQEVSFNDFIKPICLPDANFHANDLVGTQMEVGGWEGSTTKKFKTFVRIWRQAECQKTYSNILNINTTQLCAAVIKSNDRDTCRGSTGGPLMYFNRETNTYVLAGLSSFGPSVCGSQGWPDVYTDVASYLDWIHSVIQ